MARDPLYTLRDKLAEHGLPWDYTMGGDIRFCFDGKFYIVGRAFDDNGYHLFFSAPDLEDILGMIFNEETPVWK